MTTIGNRVRLGLAGPQPLAAEITTLAAEQLAIGTGATVAASWKAASDATRDDIDRRDQVMKISARNQLEGTVRGIRRGEAIANVELEVAGQRLVASITVEAVEELGLAEGSSVTALVKASDVMLAVD